MGQSRRHIRAVELVKMLLGKMPCPLVHRLLDGHRAVDADAFADQVDGGEAPQFGEDRVAAVVGTGVGVGELGHGGLIYSGTPLLGVGGVWRVLL